MDQKRPNLQSYNQNRHRYSNQPPNYYQHRPTTRNSYQHPGNHSPENRESRSTSVSTGNYSSIPKNREPHQFNQQPQPQSLNPQNQPQKPNSTSSAPQGQENTAQQISSIYNQQQILHKLNQPMLLNQIPFQMLAHQTPFQMINSQIPMQMFSQFPNQMLVNPAINLNQGNATQPNPTIPNSNLNVPAVPEVNILETGDFPALSPGNYAH